MFQLSRTVALIQENSYYAFGMQMASSTLPTVNPNKKLYNAGSEWQDDIEGLADYYSTFFREYDPVIGRFNGVDPMAALTDAITTYAYANNNPVMMNDPLGDYPAAKELPKWIRDMQADYNSWHDSRYGDNSMRGIIDRTMAMWGWGDGGSFSGGGFSVFDFRSTYGGMKIRQGNDPRAQYETNEWGEFGYWVRDRSYFENDGSKIYEDGHLAMQTYNTAVMVPDKWVPIFPSFATLLSNYPLPYSIRPDRTPIDKNSPLVDDKIGTNFRYSNQCAIRMSVCLRNSGVDLKGVKNVSNPGGQTYASGNVVGALNLATHLKGILGKPQSYNGAKQDILTLLQGKTGIVFFQNFPEQNLDGTTTTRWTNTHIDLWNKDRIMMNEQYRTPTDATRIWFWEVK